MSSYNHIWANRFAGLLKSVWTTLILCLTANQALGDQLVLFNVPSPAGINWNTPHTLLKSVVQNHNSGMSHEIGHVFVGVFCSDAGMSGPADVLTGMTTASDDTEDLLRHQGYGLGILFHNFEGRLNTLEEAQQDLQIGIQTGRLSYLAFDISKQTCERLVDYEMEYRQRGYDRNYGLPNRPLYGEGAGCSAFGVSFLEVAGIEPSIFAGLWSRTLLAPFGLVGGPMTGHFVPIRRFFLNPSLRWAAPTEFHYPISFWEPDLMHSYVLRVARREYTTPFPAEIQTWGNAYGIRMNALSVPTPEGDFFKN